MEYKKGGTTVDQISWGTRIVESGGVMLNPYTSKDSNDHLKADAYTSGGSIYRGGRRYISSGASSVEFSVKDNGTASILDGGYVSGARIAGNGHPWQDEVGRIVVETAGLIETTAISGGYLALAGDGARSIRTEIWNDGLQDVGYNNVDEHTGSAISENTVIHAGGRQVIYPKGSSSNVTVEAKGIAVVSGGHASEVLLSGAVGPLWESSVARLLVLDGGSAQHVTVKGGYIGVAGKNAETSNVELLSGGLMDVGYINVREDSGTALARNTVVHSGAKQVIYPRGSSSDVRIDSGGTVSLSGGTLSDAYVSTGGFISAVSGGYGGTVTVDGLMSGGSVFAGGTLNINSGATLVGRMTVGSGGSLQIASGGKLLGRAKLNSGGHATIDRSAGGTIFMPEASQYGLLSLTGSGTPTVLISGFKGNKVEASDRIRLQDVNLSDIVGVAYPDADTVRFTLEDGNSLSLRISGIRNKGYELINDGQGNTIFAVCFLEGTLIRTPLGERRIESIKAGEQVFVFHNGCEETQKVVWCGMKEVTPSCSNRFNTTDFPVKISVDAFGKGRPYKDLFVTPEHCLFVRGFFVPARMLVNGKSITHDTTLKTYRYYHLETETHSVIIADGLMTESYLDTGNRDEFAKQSDKPRSAMTQNCAKKSAAPLNVSREFVEQVWRELACKADVEIPSLVTTTGRPAFHLETGEGTIIKPSRVCGDRYVFQIPFDTTLLYLCSRSAKPSDAIGPFVDDRRTLGVLVGEITLFAANATKVIDVATFLTHARGWLEPENASSRWTTGRGALPIGRATRDHELRMIAIQILALGPYGSANNAPPVESQPQPVAH